MQDKLKSIRWILMDVDGVLTDGRFIYLDNGQQAKSFDVKDGFAIRLASHYGLKFGIITGKMSPNVDRRAEELNIKEVHQGYFNKLDVYKEIKEKHALSDIEIAFIGDDLFDLGVLKAVGFSACPADAVPEVVAEVDYVTNNRGGRGAVREIIDMVLKAQGKWEKIMAKFKRGD